jgi:putative endonuclease
LSSGSPYPDADVGISSSEVPMADKDELGRRGEVLAVAHLEAKGLEVVDRNWRCRQGEIDIVARDGAYFVFVEVKTRSSNAFGSPLQSITPEKLARLRRLAAAWCASHPGAHNWVRIDAVGVLMPRDGAVTIEHLPRIF